MDWKSTFLLYLEIDLNITNIIISKNEIYFLPELNLAFVLLEHTRLETPLLAPKKGLQEIYIWQDLWLLKNSQMKFRLQSIVGLNKRIFARKTRIQQLSNVAVIDFLEAYHLLGYCKSFIHFALFNQDEMMAVASFSKPKKFSYQDKEINSYELLRFVCKGGVTVVGGLSKLIQSFVALHRPCHLMSYIDLEYSNGKSMEALGFEIEKKSDPITFYIHRFTKERLSAKKVPNKNDPEWVPIQNLGNLKLVAYFL